MYTYMSGSVITNPLHFLWLSMIYWTHQGRSPYIGQMRENGTDMINFVTRNLTKPGHLVFDFAENR